MKAVLIYPSLSGKTLNIPLGLAYLGSVLEKKGFAVKIIVANAPYRNYSEEKIIKSIELYNPTFVGVSVFIWSLKRTYSLLQKLSMLGIPVIGGGPHATLFPTEVIDHGADIIVRGEGEITISELADYFIGERKLEDIAGISYKEGGRQHDNANRKMIDDLDEIDFPAKYLFNLNDFVRSETDLIALGNVISSRGCPFQCTYCDKSLWGRKYRYRSAGNIHEEILLLNKLYNITHFHFVDDNFTVDKKRVKELCELFKKRLPFEITWTCIARVDCIDKELLEKMSHAGCIGINYGIENGDPETLQRIKKGFTLDRVRDAIRWTHEAGINCGANFMFGFPWEKPENVRRTIDFMKEMSPYVKVFMRGGILTPIPATEFYEEFKEEYGFVGWWLDDKYNDEINPHLYQQIDFADGLLKTPFFPYSEEVKVQIKKGGKFIAKHNRSRQNAFVRASLAFLSATSRVLVSINPKIEVKVMPPLYGKFALPFYSKLKYIYLTSLKRMANLKKNNFVTHKK